MARKDLSRTVIEGGRRYYNSWQRRASHGTARAREREWLDRVRFDDEAAEDSAPHPPRHVYRSFHDKLAPALRWLRSNVGRPWSKVFSELCAQFDTRTIAGRHVVHDHMLEWIDTGDVSDWRFRYGSKYDFYVDGHGILRRGPWSHASYRKRRAEMEAWAAGRFAALDHRGWWWYVGDVVGPVCPAVGGGCKRKHRDVNYHRFHLQFRRQRKLTERDVQKLMKLPPGLRAELVFEPAPVVRRRR